jgi:imidazolonepropionase-like amidohydrolase
VLAAGFGVTMTGGHGHGWIGREADGPDEVRKAVREQLRAGAGAIKLFASGGVMTRGVNPRSPSFSEEELRAGVEEAHKAFRVVGAHAQATEGIKNAVRAGVDSIEHAVWLDDEAIELMLAHGTYLVATLTAPHHIINGGIGGGVPAWVLDKRADEILRDHIASFKRACAAGVKLAMGTDQGTPLNRPGENAQEIVHLQAQGLSPGAAIMAATGWAADLLRVADDRGRIAEGLAADLLLLRGDPLRDPAILAGGEHPRAVVLDGDIVHDTLGIGGG